MELFAEHKLDCGNRMRLSFMVLNSFLTITAAVRTTKGYQKNCHKARMKKCGLQFRVMPEYRFKLNRHEDLNPLLANTPPYVCRKRSRGGVHIVHYVVAVLPIRRFVCILAVSLE
jgi:hypothetical protein